MLLTQQLANQYYIYVDSNRPPEPWDIYNPRPQNRGFVAYFGRVLQAVEENLGKQGLVFYVTLSDMQKLPSYGDNVVVLIIGDEHYRLPRYIHQVGAVFKAYGTSQEMRWKALAMKPSYRSFITLVQYFSNLSLRLPLLVNYEFQKLRAAVSKDVKIAPIYDIPGGYHNSEDLPIKPIDDRAYDVFFDGSVQNNIYSKWSIKNFLKTPKIVARSLMLQQLDRFKQKYSEFHIQLAIRPAFGMVSEDDAGSYSKHLMNTKVCLVPRGTTLESFRICEALRYGCIVIVEELPDRDFYRNAPVIRIQDWSNLEPVLAQLLSDKEQMREVHKQTLEWWDTQLAEPVVGKQIAEELNQLPHVRGESAL